MELKVRAVEAVEEKSVQEVEQELLDKHEEKLIEDDNQVENTPQIKMDFAEGKSEETNTEAKKKHLKRHQSQFKNQPSYLKKTFFHILEKDTVGKLIH